LKVDNTGIKLYTLVIYVLDMVKTKPRERKKGPTRIYDDPLHRYWREAQRKRRRGKK